MALSPIVRIRAEMPVQKLTAKQLCWWVERRCVGSDQYAHLIFMRFIPERNAYETRIVFRDLMGDIKGFSRDVST